MVTQPATAISLRDGHAHKPGFGQFGDVVPGVLFAAVNLRRPRPDLCFRQFPGGRLKRGLLLGERSHFWRLSER